MRRSLTLLACLAFVSLLTSATKADPIMGTVTLTVASYPELVGVMSQGPYVYSSGPVDLGQPLQGQSLTGPPLVTVVGLLDWTTNATFNMEITFDGASGSQPTIDVTGTLKVELYGEPDGLTAGRMGNGLRRPSNRLPSRDGPLTPAF